MLKSTPESERFLRDQGSLCGSSNIVGSLSTLVAGVQVHMFIVRSVDLEVEMFGRGAVQVCARDRAMGFGAGADKGTGLLSVGVDVLDEEVE